MDKLDKEIESLVESYSSVRAIAKTIGLSYTAVRYRLARMGLKTKKKPVDAKGSAICTRCLINKPRNDYYPRSTRGSGFVSECKSCFKSRMAHKHQKNKLTLVKEFGGKCVRCGYCAVPRILHFHHLNPETKSYTLSMFLSSSLKKLRLEASKCVLLCPNCHAEEHTS